MNPTPTLVQGDSQGGGFSVQSLLSIPEDGASAIKGGGLIGISDLFENLAIPNWATAHITSPILQTHDMSGGNSGTNTSNYNNALELLTPQESNGGTISGDIYDRLVTLASTPRTKVNVNNKSIHNKQSASVDGSKKNIHTHTNTKNKKNCKKSC